MPFLGEPLRADLARRESHPQRKRQSRNLIIVRLRELQVNFSRANALKWNDFLSRVSSFDCTKTNSPDAMTHPGCLLVVSYSSDERARSCDVLSYAARTESRNLPTSRFNSRAFAGQRLRSGQAPATTLNPCLLAPRCTSRMFDAHLHRALRRLLNVAARSPVSPHPAARRQMRWSTRSPTCGRWCPRFP